VPPAPHVLTRAERAYAALRHAAANPVVRLAYFSVIALATFWAALDRANQLNIYQDAQHFTLFEDAARLSVARFHQLPLWNPYYCGGIAGLGTPSARFASPTFLLTLLFGAIRGATFASLLMTVLGLEGAYRYARAHGAGSLGAAMAAPVFAMSGIFAHATLVAWTNFFGFELVPWALIGIRLALRGSRRGVVLAALSMAWMVGLGGTYTAPLTLAAALFEVASMLVGQLGRRGRLARLSEAAWMGIAIFLLTAAASMLRLWPVAEGLQASPRLLGGTPGTSPMWVWRFLFGEPKNNFMKADFLIGLPVLPLVLWGVFRKRAIAPAIGMALFIWFAIGYYWGHASLFALLRTVPPYTMLRAPERFLVFVALAASTIAALGVRKLEAIGRKRPRYLAFAFAALALLLVDTALLVNLGWLRATARNMDPTPQGVERDFRQTRGNRWIAEYYPLMSRGSLTCFDDYDVAQTSALRADLPQEEYLKDADAGTVTRVQWSPNRIDLRVKLTKPARVYVNQNWHQGWRANVGDVVAEDGLLAVDLPAGDHDLTLRFQPRSAVAGMWTTALALAAAGIILWRSRREDHVAPGWGRFGMIALAGAPLLVVPLSFALIHEPKRAPPPLVTPSGEPMLVDKPPEDTTPLGTHWENGIVLEAGHVEVIPPGEGHGTLAIVELDWRFDEPVPPGLGVFMQLDQEKNHFATDHVLLSGVLLPEGAPLHTTVRDISEPIAIPQPKGPVTWNVYAGMWRARRDMSRLRITQMGQATLSKGRVLVGTLVATP
jgi:hypothetical protein